MFHFLGVTLDGFLVLEEIDADKHQGSELGHRDLIILENDIRIAVQKTETLLVFCTQGCRTFRSIPMMEQFYEFLFEIGNQRVLQQQFGVRVLQPDVIDAESGDGNPQLVVEHQEGYLQLHALLVVPYFHHIAYTTLHGTINDNDSVALINLLKRVTLADLEILTHHSALEAIHLLGRNPDRLSVRIPIQPDWCLQTSIELGTDKLQDGSVCAINEKKTMKVTTQCIAIHHRVIDLIVHLLCGLLGSTGAPIDFVEWDVIIARRQL